MTYFLVALGGACIVALIVAGLLKKDQYSGLHLGALGAIGLVMVVCALSGWSFAKLNYRLLLHSYQIHTKPSEVLLVDLVTLASSALPEGSIWDWYYLPHSPDLMQSAFFRNYLKYQPSFMNQLEAAAKRAERLFARNVPHGHSDLRPWALDRARRVAAVLRAHKRVLLEGPDLGDSSIPSSLFNGAIYVAQANWDAILVVQPEPVVRSLLRRFASRIVLAALLVVGALAIPWLFPALVPPTAATEFRATLLVTAAFSLLRPDLDKAREAFISFRR